VTTITEAAGAPAGGPRARAEHAAVTTLLNCFLRESCCDRASPRSA